MAIQYLLGFRFGAVPCMQRAVLFPCAGLIAVRQLGVVVIALHRFVGMIRTKEVTVSKDGRAYGIKA